MVSTVEGNISDRASLHWVLESSDWTFDEIKEHLEKGFFYVEELDAHRRTPLLALAESAKCSSSVVEILIQNGAKVDKADFYGRTPLMVALENEKCPVDVVKVLLHYGADSNHKCTMGVTPLITALRYTREDEIIRTLLQKRANPIPSDCSDPSPLCVALCCDASKEVIKLLLHAGCPLDSCKHHSSALHCATSFPNPGLRKDVLEVLLEAGADVESTNADGHQLMCFALQNGANVCTIRLLLRAGILLDSCTCHTTPLLCATSLYCDYLDMRNLSRLNTGRPQGCGGIPLKAEVVRFLLESETSTWSDEGLKPVLCALRYCDYETKAIKLLLERGRRRRMSHRNRVFCRRLLTKTIFSHNVKPSVVKLLIQHGYLKVCQVNRFNETLLHRALTNGTCPPQMVKVLLEKGSSVYAENVSEESPLEVAIRYRKNEAFLHLLLAAGSRIGAWARRKPYILKIAFREYDCQSTTDELRILEKRECLKTLLKFAFLENPDFDFSYLISKASSNLVCKANNEVCKARNEAYKSSNLVCKARNEVCKARNEVCKARNEVFKASNLVSKASNEVLSGFAKSCVGEVQNMKREVIGDGCDTLYDLISQRRRQAQIHELDNLLGFVLNNSFPIYTDLILGKISRKLLVSKLQDLPVYTVRTCDSLPLLEQKAFLCYECSCEVTRSLSYNELLSFVLAFYYLDINIANGD